jgi:MauM/NapG family ferredoxin protein
LKHRKLPEESIITPRGSQRHLRRLVRLVCLCGAVLCLLPVHDALLVLVPALSPFVAVASVMATQTVQPILGLGLLTGVVALFQQRWFCRWVCPMGLCLDTASCLGKCLKRTPCQALPIGRWVLALTLGGAILGCPLFLWMDPLALFSGLFLVTYHQHLHTSALPVLFVALLWVVSFLRPHIWCRGLCPLGAFQDLLALSSARKVALASSGLFSAWLRPAPSTIKSISPASPSLPGERIAHSRADGGLLRKSPVSRSLRRVLRPAAHVPERSTWGHPLARRSLLGLFVGATSAGVLRMAGRPAARPLRPPGAVDERILKGLCTRCGNCMRACPYDVIQRDAGQNGAASIFTPVMSFDKDYCREDCIRCTCVCPSGALVGVDLAKKAHAHMGLAQVDMQVCLLGEDRECSACMRWCPYNAIRYVFSEAEYTLVPVIDATKCNGCGGCELACPTTPSKAIRVLSSIRQPV